jgi:S1-C subfamily serine protease
MLALSLSCAGSAEARKAAPTPFPVFGNSTNSQLPPVVVNDCQFYYKGTLLVGVVSGVRIEYTNESSKTANLIEFLISDGRHSVLVRDVGTFSPGVEIIHRFPKQTGQEIYSPLFSHPKVTCRTQQAHFIDGTTWVYGENAAAASETIKSLGVVLEDKPSGVVVEFIAPGGVAANAGLEQGDRIVVFGGNSVRSIRDVDTVLSITPSGATVPIEIERSGRPVTVSVNLGTP